MREDIDVLPDVHQQGPGLGAAGGAHRCSRVYLNPLAGELAHEPTETDDVSGVHGSAS